MCHQGYLIYHGIDHPDELLKSSNKNSPRIYYFVIQDGYLRWYKDATMQYFIQEMKLSGCHLKMQSHIRRYNDYPFSFYIETKQIDIKNQYYVYSNPLRLEVTTFSHQDKFVWRKSLFLWQRLNWKVPIINSTKDISTYNALKRILATQKEIEYKQTTSNCIENYTKKWRKSITLLTPNRWQIHLREQLYEIKKDLVTSFQSTTSKHHFILRNQYPEAKNNL